MSDLAGLAVAGAVGIGTIYYMQKQAQAAQQPSYVINYGTDGSTHPDVPGQSPLVGSSESPPPSGGSQTLAATNIQGYTKLTADPAFRAAGVPGWLGGANGWFEKGTQSALDAFTANASVNQLRGNLQTGELSLFGNELWQPSFKTKGALYDLVIGSGGVTDQQRQILTLGRVPQNMWVPGAHFSGNISV